MMKKPLIIVALGLLLSSTQAPAAQDHLGIKKAEAEWEYEAGKKTVEIEIETAKPIPVDGGSGAFGYAALSAGGNNVLVLVTHLPIDDSSYEKVPSGFHTHVLDLKAPTSACAGFDFEVDIESSKQNAAFDADYQWKVKGNEAEIEGVPATDLGDAGVENIASFTLKPIVGANGKPTNLCVKVAEQI
jgi:hypothetical protein